MKKKSKADFARQQEAFNTKVEEYSKLTLEQLKELYNGPRISSTYKAAIEYVTSIKLQEEKQQAVLDAIEKSKETTEKLNESVEPLVSDVEFEEVPVEQEVKKEDNKE